MKILNKDNYNSDVTMIDAQILYLGELNSGCSGPKKAPKKAKIHILSLKSKNLGEKVKII